MIQKMNVKNLFLPVALLFIANCTWAQSPLGAWKTIDDGTGLPKSHVEIFESNGTMSAKVTQTLQKADGAVCDVCTGERKNKPYKGMVIMWGVKPKDGFWQGGRIFDPNKDAEYGVSFWFENGKPNELKVRGKHWSGIYRTQTWYRL
jgi:uncharacterized protein (DUF2147 family)